MKAMQKQIDAAFVNFLGLLSLISKLEFF